jgi:hypothetical protein
MHAHQLVDDARTRAEAHEIHVERGVENLADLALRDWIRKNDASPKTTWADFPPRTRSRIIADRARHAYTNYDQLTRLCRSQLEVDTLRGRVNSAVRAAYPEI